MFRVARLAARPIYGPSVYYRDLVTTCIAPADKQKVDQLLNPLSQTYADAKDEYEIAIESLGTTYAKEDIASAKELTEKVVRDYEAILRSDTIGEEEKKVVKERVGQRIRELVVAVEGNLKESD